VKKLGKILLAIFVLLAVAITFTIGWRPFIGPKTRATTNRQFERTPERLARGRYLADGLAGCETCHSPKDWNTHGAPNVPGMELAGQLLPIPGLPGTIVASNLTPDPETGAGRWSDDQIARSIREGVAHDGRTIFPIMPYEAYRTLSDEDVASIVVYLRSVSPVRNPLPPTKVLVDHAVRRVRESERRRSEGNVCLSTNAASRETPRGQHSHSYLLQALPAETWGWGSELVELCGEGLNR
jgi:hypothetical protein